MYVLGKIYLSRGEYTYPEEKGVVCIWCDATAMLASKSTRTVGLFRVCTRCAQRVLQSGRGAGLRSEGSVSNIEGSRHPKKRVGDKRNKLEKARVRFIRERVVGTRLVRVVAVRV